jgi:hypothetical protein
MSSSSSSSRHEPIERRPFGRHRDLVSIIGLGGYHLGKAKTVGEAVRIVHAAIDAGVNSSTTRGSTTTVRANGGWDARSRVAETPSS